jgi:hypothetical protein
MTDFPSSQCVFVTAEYALAPSGGGVQRCTHEYLASLKAAGFSPLNAVYQFDRRVLTRLKRKFRPRPYQDLVAPSTVADTARLIRTTRPAWVFFNQIEAAQLAATLAPVRENGTRFAMLSHGVDSSDYLHTARVTESISKSATWLGRQLFAEMQMHRYFDVIFCLSETDRVFHQWLGGRSVHLVPRIIDNHPIDWHPIKGRIGTIGTLDHAPNYEGLVLLCEALQQSKSTLKLRIIGRPEARGRELASRFPMVEYLGGLNDEEFAAEAQSWSAFVNPIFCYARGCSTKLAVPMSWHLPVATTRAGARGYWWDESIMPLADTPDQLVASLHRLIEADDARRIVSSLARQSPQLNDVAKIIGTALAAASRTSL